MKYSPIDLQCINSIRSLSLDAIEKANSGHPGLPLGAAPMAYVLWQNFLQHDPSCPDWPNRDRFILSAGHGSMLLYSLLHLSGYDVSIDDLKNFRQWGSRTPGHPEFGLTPGVECTTGPLGQGASNAIGMAIAERSLAYRHSMYPGLVDHFTYVLVGDGDLMEGVSAEAASLAGHLGLGKLITLYDSNGISLDGPTSLTFSTEDVKARYESYGWQVIEVEDADQDLEAIHKALCDAKSDTEHPSLIICKTTIGYGSPYAGTSKVHGQPLKGGDVVKTKRQLGIENTEPFFVSDEVMSHFKTGTARGNILRKSWEEKYPPNLQSELKDAPQCDLSSIDWAPFSPGEGMASRQASGQVINRIAKACPALLGGDADLSCSTNTLIEEGGSFDGRTGSGRNIHYGVREHAMAAIENGMLYHGGIRPFVATFFCFADYMRPAIRLAAMNHLPAIYVFTHDSIFLGEDGPTHQPVEHLLSLRCIPNLTVLRPGDANEVQEAWKVVLENKTSPTALVLTRQKIPTLDRRNLGTASELKNGAYILKESSLGQPECILMASGSEIHLALKAQDALEAKKLPTRVVSFPSWELFNAQDDHYKEKVLPSRIQNRISIEAGVTLGWEKYIGATGFSLGIDRFGASAPQSRLELEFGFTVENIVNHAMK